MLSSKNNVKFTVLLAEKDFRAHFGRRGDSFKCKVIDEIELYMKEVSSNTSKSTTTYSGK